MWHQNNAADDGCSKTNAETERKLANSSVEPQDQGKRPDSYSKVQKGPDKGGGQLEKHPTGATSYEHLKINISNKVEHDVPPNSPGAVYTQPCNPKQEMQWLPDEHLHSQVLKRLELHHNDVVNERRLKLNIDSKRN